MSEIKKVKGKEALWALSLGKKLTNGDQTISISSVKGILMSLREWKNCTPIVSQHIQIDLNEEYEIIHEVENE